MTDVTCALAVITPAAKMLIVHPTNAGYYASWSLPKGIKDPGEAERDAAARECFEETGLDLRDVADKFIDCGRHSYVAGKDLHMFLYEMDRDPDETLFECTTHFTDKSGKQVVEVDRHSLVDYADLKKLLNKKQLAIVEQQILKIQMEPTLSLK